MQGRRRGSRRAHPPDRPRRLGELPNTRSCSIAWRAHQLAAVSRDALVTDRRTALARAGRWLGILPPRLPLEQEDALRSIAKRCGYSTAAVQRTFHARYWNPPVSAQSVIVTLDAETLERLRAAARSERATLADVIRQAIRAQLSSTVRKRT